MALVPQQRICDRTPTKVIQAGEKLYSLPGFILKDADGVVVLQHDGYKELCKEGFDTCLRLLRQMYLLPDPGKKSGGAKPPSDD
jgi:hypothetical protein